MLAISEGSDDIVPLAFILSTVSDFAFLPRISLRVSHVFLGLLAFSCNFDVKYSFFAARSTR